VRKGGYYHLLLRPGLRLIGLNNNDCYKYNWWVFFSIDEISQQLQWLHNTLLQAESSNEKVHMLVHIASGEGSCFSFWSREYRRVIERFHGIISAQFNGHSHVDEFNVFYDSRDVGNAINVAWNGGSVTTFIDLNPNYNVYWIDDEAFVSLKGVFFFFGLSQG
jgi:sphingomyelin phosphodiesterase